VSTCGHVTRRGKPCGRKTRPGSDRCGIHERGEQGWRAMLTPEVADRITALLRAGNYDEVAARGAGIAPRTFREWMQRGAEGAEGDEPYAELRERVEKARAEGEALHVARIAKAAEDDWHASAWFLERSYPGRWGRVSPRPFDDYEKPTEEEQAARGVFAEVDELARKRAKRT
jgi:hypothetical protein